MSNHTDQYTALRDAAEAFGLGGDGTSRLLEGGWNVQFCHVTTATVAETLGKMSCHLWRGEEESLQVAWTYGATYREAAVRACQELMGPPV